MILITRPLPDALRTVDALAAHGVPAMACPVMDVVTNTKPSLPAAEDIGALIFTSANGVRAWAARGGATGLSAYYVGPSSQEEGEAYGLTTLGVGASDSEALTALIITHRPRGRLWHISGHHRAGNVADVLRAAGLHVETLALYEAKARSRFEPAVSDWFAARPRDEAFAAGFFSPRTVGLFASVARAHSLDDAISVADAYCLSDAVAQRARALLPFKCIHTALQPDNTSFVDMLLSRRT